MSNCVDDRIALIGEGGRLAEKEEQNQMTGSSLRKLALGLSAGFLAKIRGVTMSYAAPGRRLRPLAEATRKLSTHP